MYMKPRTVYLAVYDHVGDTGSYGEPLFKRRPVDCKIEGDSLIVLEDIVFTDPEIEILEERKIATIVVEDEDGNALLYKKVYVHSYLPSKDLEIEV